MTRRHLRNLGIVSLCLSLAMFVAFKPKNAVGYRSGTAGTLIDGGVVAFGYPAEQVTPDVRFRFDNHLSEYGGTILSWPVTFFPFTHGVSDIFLSENLFRSGALDEFRDPTDDPKYDIVANMYVEPQYNLKSDRFAILGYAKIEGLRSTSNNKASVLVVDVGGLKRGDQFGIVTGAGFGFVISPFATELLVRRHWITDAPNSWDISLDFHF